MSDKRGRRVREHSLVPAVFRHSERTFGRIIAQRLFRSLRFARSPPSETSEAFVTASKRGKDEDSSLSKSRESRSKQRRGTETDFRRGFGETDYALNTLRTSKYALQYG